MSVWLRNLQKAVALNERLVHLHCLFLLRSVGAAGFDVSVVCVGVDEIRDLNRVYRNEDRETDVLAFPYHEGLDPGHLPQPVRECDYNLGDIILCPSVIAEACDSAVRVEERLPVIEAHGLCHLIGYHHSNLEALKRMLCKEQSLLTLFNRTFGTQLAPLTSAASHDH